MGESGAVKTAVETCILEGKLAIGLAAGQCDPQATGSSILTGATQGAAIPANTGVPRVLDPLTGGAGDTITATFGNGATAELKTAAWATTWTRNANGSWSCATSAAMPAKYKPTGCP